MHSTQQVLPIEEEHFKIRGLFFSAKSAVSVFISLVLYPSTDVKLCYTYLYSIWHLSVSAATGGKNNCIVFLFLI